jgi:hypothetical protein
MLVIIDSRHTQKELLRVRVEGTKFRCEPFVRLMMSGVYIYRMTADAYSVTKKLVVIR